MNLFPILQPLKVDWNNIIQELNCDSNSTSHYHAEQSTKVAAQLFSLCVSTSELDMVRQWLISPKSTNSSARPNIEAVIRRAPRHIITDVDIDSLSKGLANLDNLPVAAITTSQVKEKLTHHTPSTQIESTMLFPTSKVAESARNNVAQPFRGEVTKRMELWENLIRPFSYADEILLCDPYILQKALEIHDPLKSGLAFWIRRWSELASKEKRKIVITVLSAHGSMRTKGENTEIVKTDVEQLLNLLLQVTAPELKVKVRMVPYADPQRRPILHARYLIARQDSHEVRALVFDDSVMADVKDSARLRTGIINVSLFTDNSKVKFYADDWTRALKHCDLKI